MNKGLCFLAFVCGAVAGACGAWYIAEKKFEEREQEAVDSVKERYTIQKPVTLDEALEKTREKIPSVNKLMGDLSRDNKETNDQGMMEYATKLAKEGYTKYSHTDDKSTPIKGTEEDTDYIYIISPDDFGDQEEYDKISLTYYSDEVLVDENDDVISDEDLCVPSDFASHFGEYEDDSVFVRNDRLKTDYEILMDPREYYGEIVAEKPKDVEVQ